MKNKLRIPLRTDYKLEFVDDRANGYLIIFALVFNEVYKNKIHEELMFAEITPGEHKFGSYPNVIVRWEDNFFAPVAFHTLEEAKKHILDNYHSHTPHSNGKVFDKKD